ncbi:MAG: class I SAM-dependent methyltransferase [Polyangiales bacterium]
MAATLPEARVLGIDVSEASLTISRQAAEAHGLENLELMQRPLESVPELGRDFDYIECHGVLHHLAAPEAGLQALARVTRPAGALSVMVYAQHGRQGIHLLQTLCQRLGLQPDEAGVERAQTLLTQLPDNHPFARVHADPSQRVSLEEVADMLLHPRERCYTVDALRSFIEAAGLRLHRWLPQAEYSLPPALQDIAPLGAEVWAQASAAELFFGTHLKHRFVLTHPARASAAELFDGALFAQAVPSLSPQLQAQPQGDQVYLRHEGHQLPLAFVADPREVAPYLRLVDGQQSIEALAAQLHAQGHVSSAAHALERYRALYRADLLEMHCALG